MLHLKRLFHSGRQKHDNISVIKMLHQMSVWVVVVALRLGLIVACQLILTQRNLRAIARGRALPQKGKADKCNLSKIMRNLHPQRKLVSSLLDCCCNIWFYKGKRSQRNASGIFGEGGPDLSDSHTQVGTLIWILGLGSRLPGTRPAFLDFPKYR